MPGLRGGDAGRAAIRGALLAGGAGRDGPGRGELWVQAGGCGTAVCCGGPGPGAGPPGVGIAGEGAACSVELIPVRYVLPVGEALPPGRYGQEYKRELFSVLRSHCQSTWLGGRVSPDHTRAAGFRLYFVLNSKMRKKRSETMFYGFREQLLRGELNFFNYCY